MSLYYAYYRGSLDDERIFTIYRVIMANGTLKGLSTVKVEWMLVIFIHAILVFVCYTDIRWRKITNCTTSLILLLSLLLAFNLSDSFPLMALLILFISGFILSLVGVIGAGDVKLVCALSTGISTTGIGHFLLLIGILGIPLTLITLLYYRAFSIRNVITIPYGVAICCSYWMLWAV